ncbi:hypothetical protein QJS04_geneDACA011799 [Acorus gramineus]|uniref:Uncharacterized protein n=1 Tax=Acorus gramineus TaxID=55184 RepID=A0AAV9BEB8_ACOGR|nr:hypothetical protein QJS04_geneDACA011799 [Acorus gramineus]
MRIGTGTQGRQEGVTLARRHVPRNAKAMPHDHVKQPKSTTLGQDVTSTDIKQPQTFFGHEGSALVPGFGRFIFNPRMVRGSSAWVQTTALELP